ncbi:MAG: tRNA (guanosine(37)-N1)-methyltransferase TrmD [Granulicella sp.]
MQFDIVTIFPGFFEGFLNHGVLSRALNQGIATITTHDLRAFTHDRHKTVDDRPFGGGEGMVLKPAPLVECVESLALTPKPKRDPAKESVVLLSAQGRRFTQSVAHQLAATERIVFLCGRYEGVDERVNELLCDRELSIGDYILSGGELGAAVIIDSIVRLLPGVLGNPDSARFESFGADLVPTPHIPGHPPASTNAAAGILDYPHYTRPADFRGHPVPDVLTGGSHEDIRRWRRERALEKTMRNRPDLLDTAPLTDADRFFLSRLHRRSVLEDNDPF